MTHGERDVLLIVDVQNDFCPGGALPVPRGDEVVAVIRGIMKEFAHIVFTQDWHPPGHQSFASTYPGRMPFQSLAVAYGEQVLWPDHCVQGTWGAELHAGLDVSRAELILRKGFRAGIDSYSAFRENDRRTRTGLAGYLRERGIERVFLAGLARDYCVKYSAEDAQEEGFEAVILEEACRSLNG